MKPRPYQDRCVHAVREAWLTHQSVLAVLATGLGKTVIAANVIRAERAERFLVFAHREELIDQSAEAIRAWTGEAVGVEMADRRAGDERVVVGTVQTLAARGSDRFAQGRFTRVVVDEAHHAVARSYKSVLGFWPEAKLLGITATPRRSDGLAMGQVFFHVAFDYGVADAIADGYLVPVRQHAVEVEGLDFSNLKTVAGDFSDGDLERILTEEGVLQQMALPALEIAGDLPGIVFCSGVAHAKLMAAILNRYKPASAVALSGETPKEERRTWVERYKAGKVQWLCNCGLFLEGFDAPHTAVVVMGRPTKSLALYTQILGRGTRPLKGVIDTDDLLPEDRKDARRSAIASSEKPFCKILDFQGNAGRHKLVSSCDVLGGKYGEPVRQYAKKTIGEEGAGVAVEDALDRADAELALLAEEEDRRRRIKARAATYTAREVDPFGGAGEGGGGGSVSGQQGEPATDKQVGYLVRVAGWSRAKAESLTKRQASAIIGKHRSAA